MGWSTQCSWLRWCPSSSIDFSLPPSYRVRFWGDSSVSVAFSLSASLLLSKRPFLVCICTGYAFRCFIACVWWLLAMVALLCLLAVMLLKPQEGERSCVWVLLGGSPIFLWCLLFFVWLRYRIQVSGGACSGCQRDSWVSFSLKN